MPPATIDDVAAGRGLDRPRVPERPRTPSTAPGRAAQIACVTAPTARTVWTSRSPFVSPETEIGTSPIPKA